MQKTIVRKTSKPKRLTKQMIEKRNRFAQIAQNDIANVDYKNTKFLGVFVDSQGKIVPKKFN